MQIEVTIAGVSITENDQIENPGWMSPPTGSVMKWTCTSVMIDAVGETMIHCSDNSSVASET